MTNAVPRTNEALPTFAGDIANGLAQHGAALEILQNTEAKVRADIAAYDLASTNFEVARDDVSNREKAARVAVIASIHALTVARDNLKPTLGRSYNQAWDITGLVGSLVVPQELARVQRLLIKFNIYFAANPLQEIPSKNITAANFQVLFDDMDDTRAAVNSQETVRDNARIVRDQKAAQLRKRLSDTIKELGMKMGPLDPRWKAFGLNMPGAKATPAVPQNVTAVLIGNNAVAVKWNGAPRAEYYRVWKKVNGVDQEMVVAGSAADLDFTIEHLPANATVEIAISAVNPTGESALSKTITVVMP